MAALSYLTLTIALFLAFAIGLNLGLHGVILFHEASPKTNSDGKEPSPASPSLVVDMPAYISTSGLETPIDHRSPIVPPQPKVRTSPTRTIESSKLAPNFQKSLNNQLDIPSLKSTEPHPGLKEVVENVEAKIRSEVDLKRFSQSILSAYRNTPILLLTCNRASLLDETIKSLLQVRGVSKDNILVIQDGKMEDVSSVVKKYDLALVQNLAGLRLRGGAGSDGASRIAQHYKFALSTGFDRFPKANAVIVVEDDLLFSPDFYEYLTSVAPVLDADETTFVVSAWNDNGFKDKVRETHAVRRTEFFPGLGWILPRRLYKGELEAKWPREHWDHWLRSEEIHRNRECVYPQMPRTYHNGVRGTFMDESTHNRYFRDIANNRDESVSWDSAVNHLALAQQAPYEARIKTLIQSQCKHLHTLADLFSNEKEQVLCVWINVATMADYSPPFEAVGRFFGIWHEHKRGNHKGLHEFYFLSNYILLLNVHEDIRNNQVYRRLQPSDVHPFTKEYFTPSSLAALKSSHLSADQVFTARQAGMNCNDVCGEHNKRCKAGSLEDANSCDTLRQHFPCSQCSGSIGAEQPAYVREDARPESLPQQCLFNQDTRAIPITCEASHPDTLRLCVCE